MLYSKIITSLLVVLGMLSSCTTSDTKISLISYVDPFIGTGGHGHTFPGATVPFGSVQLSPQTRVEGWDGTSGYHYSDDTIYGFAHTALSGTGVSDYGDILITPARVLQSPEKKLQGSYFRKSKEFAKPNYYSVFLEDTEVEVKLTTSQRSGIHQYTFYGNGERYLLLDLKYRDLLLDSKIEYLAEENAFTGFRQSSNWAKDMRWFFYLSFDCDIESMGVLEEDKKIWIKFSQDIDVVTLKIALSAVDEQGSKKNYFHEIADMSFEECLKNGQDLWEEKLNKILVEGGTKDQKTIFYTALYHCFVQPNLYKDIDGRYRGLDQNIYHTEGDYYTVFSLWDTYRAWHPLMTLIDSAATLGFIHTIVDMYDKTGRLPIWELAANETGTMIGNHAISVLADAIVKGYPIEDNAKILEAIVNSVNIDELGYKEFRKYGFIPGDREHESISKTLEYAYNDWCIAQIAMYFNDKELYHQYIMSAQYYKNIFDPSTGFMRPKINGSWMRPFDPTVVDWHFTEANAWQYNFYVPHDVKGLIDLHGGEAQLKEKIDSLFAIQIPIGGRDMKDITGLIGQYAHGNEPSHHMAYFYNFLGYPETTQFRVREIMDDLYSTKPDGLSGNEDCGQMSAWIVLSAMGFYSFTPGSEYYTLGSPWFEKITIQLENGKKFTINNKNFSSKSIYIKESYLNGKLDNKSFLFHKDIVSGGEITFVRSVSKPTVFGKGSQSIPTMGIDNPLVTINPTFGQSEEVFKDSVLISLESLSDSYDLYISSSPDFPSENARLYQGPFYEKESKTLYGFSFHPETQWSLPVPKAISKLPRSLDVTITSPVSPNYTARGSVALVDGMRGTTNWRVGRWVGFQGNDMEVVLDFGPNNHVSTLELSFLQDIKSWIWFPTQIQAWGSKDGDNFVLLNSIHTMESIEDYKIAIKEWTLPLGGPYRHVKIMAKQLGTIPEWHLGAGYPSYIFIDEILYK
jgi:predicted alpha-1,2-mannosidase